MEPHAIALSGVSHSFADVHVLDNFSLTVDVGSFVSIVGPSGCGKSTVLRMLAGLLAPTHGTVNVNGTSAVLRPGLVGYMAQRDLLLPWKRAFDNACIGGDVAGQNPSHTRTQARELFDQFGLAGFEHAWPSQLSGGMRQRLALLRTYLIGANVMLLDEPFGALDAITRRDLHTWLQQFWLADTSSSTTVVFVTHDVEEALFLSDNVHVMSTDPATSSRPSPHHSLDLVNQASSPITNSSSEKLNYCLNSTRTANLELRSNDDYTYAAMVHAVSAARFDGDRAPHGLRRARHTGKGHPYRAARSGPRRPIPVVTAR